MSMLSLCACVCTPFTPFAAAVKLLALALAFAYELASAYAVAFAFAYALALIIACAGMLMERLLALALAPGVSELESKDCWLTFNACARACVICACSAYAVNALAFAAFGSLSNISMGCAWTKRGVIPTSFELSVPLISIGSEATRVM